MNDGWLYVDQMSGRFTLAHSFIRRRIPVLDCVPARIYWAEVVDDRAKRA